MEINGKPIQVDWYQKKIVENHLKKLKIGDDSDDDDGHGQGRNCLSPYTNSRSTAPAAAMLLIT